MRRHTMSVAAIRRVLGVTGLVAAVTAGALACGSASGSGSASADKAAGGSGTTSSSAPADPSTPPAAPAVSDVDVADTSVDDASVVGSGGPAVGWASAAAVAEKAVPSGKFTSAELNDRNGKPVWQVDVMTDGPRVTGVDVDAVTGKVLSKAVDRMPDQVRKYLSIPLAQLSSAGVARDAAASKALASIGGGFVSSVSIGGNGAGPRWEIGVSRDGVVSSVDVDALTSAVISKYVPQEALEQSGNLGTDYYDWTQHLPGGRS